VEHYPYSAYRRTKSDDPRLCVRVGDRLLDLAETAKRQGFDRIDLLDQSNLNPMMKEGRVTWRAIEDEIRGWVEAGSDELIPIVDVELVMPFAVADYIDFYASEHHARNLARILRPGQPELQPNWLHQPVGYHGRAGTIVVSGTPVVRPKGNIHLEGAIAPRPTTKLDVEVEVGFVVGVPSERGRAVPIDKFVDHVFGVVLVNDWSARDIQAFETVPLGPFLGKSFQTSISPWVVPLSALETARIPVPSNSTELSPYLHEPEPWGLDISLELEVNGEVVSRPPYKAMHWSPAQMLAHLTVNGASIRTGDLYASGTVSGPQPDEVGSLIERWGNERFLQDGDEVVIRGRAGEVDLGEVRGRVEPAR
jgi:fumarylacetoacetase